MKKELYSRIKDFSYNVAHGIKEFALRISNITFLNISSIDSFTAYNVQNTAIKCDYLQNVILKNLVVSDSKVAAIQISFARQFVGLEKIIIIGKSQFQSDDYNCTGLILPNYDSLSVKGIQFSQFSSNMTLISNAYWLTKQLILSTKYLVFSLVSIDSSASSANILNLLNSSKNIIYDSDGSLTGQTSYVTLNKQYYSGNLPQQIILVTKNSVQNCLFNTSTDVGQIIIDNLAEKSVKSYTGGQPWSYFATFINQKAYNISFSKEFDKLTIQSLYDQNEAVLLRIATKKDVLLVQKADLTNYTYILQEPNPLQCNHGDWWFNLQLLFICVRGLQPITITASNSNILYESSQRKWSDIGNWQNLQLPTLNSSVTIPQTWTILLDIDTPILQDLIVEGTLILDKDKQIHLQARNIYVKGKLLISDQGRITLYSSDTKIIVNNKVYSKSLIVTGNIQFIGKKIKSAWTRLIEFADQGSKNIKVQESFDWKIDDEIILGPSGKLYSQHEKLKIVSIEDNYLYLSEPLKYDHFGDSQQTLGNLDMRAVVGHLTRSIRIGGSLSEDQGCRIVILGSGSAVLKGVEVVNCGWDDQAGLSFFSPSRIMSYIIGCTFHDSNGPLLSLSQTNDVLIESNVFYNGTKSLVTMMDGLNNIFRNNVLVYVKLRVLQGVFASASLGNFINSYDEISGNVGQGSEDSGFLMMSQNCSSFKINNNTVSSTETAGFAFRQFDALCSLIADYQAFHCKVGIMAAMQTKQIRVENITLAENSINIIIKGGVDDEFDNAYIVKNWVISALARPNCPKCYSSKMGSVCSDSIGMQLVSQSTVSYPPPLSKPSNLLDSITTVQKLDGRVYMDQVTFQNFKLSYILPTCRNNNVFTQHPGAHDMTCSHYLTQTKCENCDKFSLFSQEYIIGNLRFINNNSSLKGWFGGCGSFECTGLANILVHDQDGSFLGNTKQVVQADLRIPQCTRVEQWNGYECNGENIAIMNWMSIAFDHDVRLYSPILLLKNGQQFNKVNSMKEWDWDGGQPVGNRESHFIGLIQLYSVIEFQNAGINPTDQLFWLHKRLLNGKKTDWLVARMKYQTSSYVQVLVGNKIVHPDPIQLDGNIVLSKKDLGNEECGANVYNPSDQSIEFVVSGDKDCLVRVRQVNSIRMKVNLIVSYEQFVLSERLGKFRNFLQEFIGNQFIVRIITVNKNGEIVVSIESNQAIGSCNVPICDNEFYPYDTDQEEAYYAKLKGYIVQNIPQLENTLQQLRRSGEDPIRIEIIEITGQVQYNLDYPSTEDPLFDNNDIFFTKVDKVDNNNMNNWLGLAVIPVIVLLLLAGRRYLRKVS